MALLDLGMVYGTLKNIKSALVTWEIFTLWNIVIGFLNCYKQSDTMHRNHPKHSNLENR